MTELAVFIVQFYKKFSFANYVIKIFDYTMLLVPWFKENISELEVLNCIGEYNGTLFL